MDTTIFAMTETIKKHNELLLQEAKRKLMNKLQKRDMQLFNAWIDAEVGEKSDLAYAEYQAHKEIFRAACTSYFGTDIFAKNN